MDWHALRVIIFTLDYPPDPLPPTTITALNQAATAMQPALLNDVKQLCLACPPCHLYRLIKLQHFCNNALWSRQSGIMCEYELSEYERCYQLPL